MPSVAEALAANTAGLKENADAGRVVVRTTGHLTGPIESTWRSGKHKVIVDEPGALAGEDTAPGPVDYAVIALASCQAVTYRFWAEKLGIQLDDIDVTVAADIDLRGFFGVADDVRAGFSNVVVEVTPKGPESAERYQELADAANAHCPVLDLFSNGTTVEHKVAVTA